ncbi:UbiA family prenyltransferase [Candidatus Marinimicrobia bacterium]|nr:UbiA family prenyltransferase [Candidatus Neomarinimicrobiota bacterium]
MSHIFNLIRVYNVLLSGATVFIAAYLLDFYLFYSTFKLSIIVMSTMTIGNIMNDLLDIESDQINHPDRALASNKLTTRSAILMLSFSVFILVYFSLQISFKGLFFLYGFILPLLFSYNIYFKKFPIIGNIIVSLLLGSVFLFTELVLIDSFSILCVPLFLVIIFSFVREIIKDMEDYDGDKHVGMLTLPVIVGKQGMNHIIIVSVLTLIIVLLFPFIFWNYNLKYLLLLIILIEIPLIYSLILLVKYPSKKTYASIAGLLKILTIGGLLIIMVSKN